LSGIWANRKRPRVVVIGGANMDIKCRIAGRTALASSNPGIAVLAPGGVARNIAENLARMGAAASLISVVGRDDLGALLLHETAHAGVGLGGTVRGRGPTGLYAATLDAGGELIVGVAAMDILKQLTPRRLQRQRRLVAAADMIVADSNLPGDTLEWLIDYAARHGLRLAIEAVSVPKGSRLKRLLRAGRPLLALFCNRAEAQALTGRAQMRGAARRLHDLGVANVCVGLGRRGMFVSSAGGAQATVPAVPAEIVDVTGAGDAAVAGTLFGLVRSEPLAAAARYGQAAAALTVSCAQSVNPRLSRKAIARCLRRRGPSP
jgi:pseudouridine kinase